MHALSYHGYLVSELVAPEQWGTVPLCLFFARAPSSSDDVPNMIGEEESDTSLDDPANLSDSSHDAFFGSSDNIPALANVRCVLCT